MENNQPSEKGPAQVEGRGYNIVKTIILPQDNMYWTEKRYGKAPECAVCSSKVDLPDKEERLEI